MYRNCTQLIHIYIYLQHLAAYVGRLCIHYNIAGVILQNETQFTRGSLVSGEGLKTLLIEMNGQWLGGIQQHNGKGG